MADGVVIVLVSTDDGGGEEERGGEEDEGERGWRMHDRSAFGVVVRWW